MKNVTLDVSSISSWDDFHDLFCTSLKFPYYGRNMDAWIDCMSDPKIVGAGYFIHLEGTDELKARCLEIFETLNECAAFVNYRCHQREEPPLIALSYYV
jgi:RNAse (barnase) inhibitor barstar